MSVDIHFNQCGTFQCLWTTQHILTIMFSNNGLNQSVMNLRNLYCISASPLSIQPRPRTYNPSESQVFCIYRPNRIRRSIEIFRKGWQWVLFEQLIEWVIRFWITLPQAIAYILWWWARLYWTLSTSTWGLIYIKYIFGNILRYILQGQGYSMEHGSKFICYLITKLNNFQTVYYNCLYLESKQGWYTRLIYSLIINILISIINNIES